MVVCYTVEDHKCGYSFTPLTGPHEPASVSSDPEN